MHLLQLIWRHGHTGSVTVYPIEQLQLIGGKHERKENLKDRDYWQCKRMKKEKGMKKEDDMTCK